MNFEDWWYPFYVQHYRRDTMHLGLAQEGAYRRLIDEYMVTGGPLSDNDVALARICGCGLDEWADLSHTIRPFFEASNGKLVHKRCEYELNTQRIRAQKLSANGKAAVEARWKNHRENKEIIRGVYGANTPGIRNHTTRQDKTSSFCVEGGSLATALPTGALREPQPSQSTVVSDELKLSIERRKGIG